MELSEKKAEYTRLREKLLQIKEYL